VSFQFRSHARGRPPPSAPWADGVESQAPIVTGVAYGAIVLFLVILLIVVVRTIVLFSGLWILPVARVLRHVPGMRRVVKKLEGGASREAGSR
jgi:hypothetical protein